MLITLMLLVALMSIALLAVLPRIRQQVQRDRELELQHRGTAYMRAIQHFYKKFGRYPSRVEELENTNNLKFLRKRYKDPVNRDPATGKERDFKFLHQQDISLNSGPVLPGQTQGQPPFGGQGGQPPQGAFGGNTPGGFGGGGFSGPGGAGSQLGEISHRGRRRKLHLRVNPAAVPMPKALRILRDRVPIPTPVLNPVPASTAPLLAEARFLASPAPTKKTRAFASSSKRTITTIGSSSTFLQTINKACWSAPSTPAHLPAT